MLHYVPELLPLCAKEDFQQMLVSPLLKDLSDLCVWILKSVKFTSTHFKISSFPNDYVLISPLVTNIFMYLFTFCFCELQECIERCPSLKQEADDSAKGWVICHLMFFCISFWILFYFNPCSQTVEDHRHCNWKK